MSEQNLNAFHQLVNQRVNAFLNEQIQSLPNDAPTLKQAVEYALLVGGKRMRPLLHCVVADTLAVDGSDAITVGAAIECIHAYSLVHDDLPAMDDDDLRRGQPTCHVKFDEATAILAGDALQTLAFEILASTPLQTVRDSVRINLVRCISEASGYRGMCGGQAMDLAATDTQVSLEHLIQLHRLKTGALLKACVKSATLLASDIPQQHTDSLLEYADAIGLAFQVQDDILDVTASSETLGKPAGSDEKSNKSTFPALLGLAASQNQLQEYHAQALQALDRLPYNTQLLRQFADLMLSRTH
ncbi:polyprenyl synthetase family protein [Alteromonas facilis]|uniref:polyprenyl synthetase family protein n=1 Tax=Alteromonas facilis TaxID=2048004 RepID=UPI000C288C36|nr:farnesyl diphosphate synthase [Alteromonas facilis]